MRWRWLPSFEMPSSTTSPAFRCWGGLRPMPTPNGAAIAADSVEGETWQAAAAPKGLPPAVRAKLEAELAASAQAPDIKPQFEAIGFEVVATNGEQFKKFLTDEIARWKNVIDTGKITAE